MSARKKSCSRTILLALTGLAAVCLLLAAATAYMNNLPVTLPAGDRLSAVEKARLAEVTHLRQTLGDQVLPGWSQADIPLVVFNEAYLFLVGIEDPEDGWYRVPPQSRLGEAWVAVPGEDFYGQPYYRQDLRKTNPTTDNFVVRVGDAWAASAMSLDWMMAAFPAEMGKNLPGFVQPFVPWPVVTNLFIPGADTYLAMVEHEAVHAYQGIRAPERLLAAENAGTRFSKQYPWESESLEAAWQTELDLLNEAVQAETEEEMLTLARAFLDQRDTRRQAENLSYDLIQYERHREWVEGIAKYGERQIYLLAMSPDYEPLPEMASDPEFDDYGGAQKKWDQEVDQIRRMAGDEGDGRFYYSGFAQAVLLDRLSPDWKERLFDEGVWLEDLLKERLFDEGVWLEDLLAEAVGQAQP